MTISISELHKCEEIRTNEHKDYVTEATLYFKVTGTTSETEAIAAMRSDTTTVPTTYNGCSLDSFRVSDWMGVNGFEIEAIYKRSSGGGISSSSSLPDETVRLSGDLMPIHVAYSKGYRDSSNTDYAYGHQIEPTADGVNAVGCDSYSATGTLVITSYFRTLSMANRIAIMAYLNHVNSNTFRGFAAGTLLFSHFEANEIGDGSDAYVECEYVFSYQPNGTATFKGDNDTLSVTKYGWEYAWGEYQMEESSGTTYRNVIGAYAEKLFDTATFDSTTLQISDT